MRPPHHASPVVRALPRRGRWTWLHQPSRDAHPAPPAVRWKWTGCSPSPLLFTERGTTARESSGVSLSASGWFARPQSFGAPESFRFDGPKSCARSLIAPIKFGSTMWRIVLQLHTRYTRAPTPSLWVPSSNTDEVFSACSYAHGTSNLGFIRPILTALPSLFRSAAKSVRVEFP
jgi:hypothetical protein